MLNEWITQIESTKQTFWDIKKDFISQSGTTCYYWDPLDDKSEEEFQEESEYLIAIGEFMKPVPMGKYFDVGRSPQTIAWDYFAVKPTINRTVQLD